MMPSRPVRTVLAALAAVLMAAFAGSAFAGADTPSQGKTAPDCKAKPDDPRCRGAK